MTNENHILRNSIAVLSALLCCTAFANQDVREGIVKMIEPKVLELKAKVDALKERHCIVTNDLERYQTVLNAAMSVKMSDVEYVTNKTTYSGTSTVVTKVSERRISSGEKRFKRLFLLLNNDELSGLYSKYFSNKNFSRLKNDFKSEYQEVKDDYRRLVSTRNSARNETAKKIGEVRKSIVRDKNLMKQKLMQDFTLIAKCTKRYDYSNRKKYSIVGINRKKKNTMSDRLTHAEYHRVVDIFKHYQMDAPSYSDEINVEQMKEIRRCIQSEINNLDQIFAASSIDNRRDKLYDLERSERIKETDENAEENYLTRRLVCIKSYMSRITTDVIDHLEALKNELNTEIVEEFKAMEQLVNMNNSLDFMTSEEMTKVYRQLRDDKIASVMGSQFVEELKAEQAEKDRQKREELQREHERRIKEKEEEERTKREAAYFKAQENIAKINERREILAELVPLNSEIARLEREKQECGIFEGNKKKAIQRRIDELRAQTRALSNIIE